MKNTNQKYHPRISQSLICVFFFSLLSPIALFFISNFSLFSLLCPVSTRVLAVSNWSESQFLNKNHNITGIPSKSLFVRPRPPPTH